MELYSSLCKEFERLSPPIDIKEFTKEFIFSEVDPSIVLSLVREFKAYILPMPASLKEEEVKTLTTKILGLMEVSDSWEHFTQLNEKRKKKKQENEKPLTDFDKILKAFMAVDKPKEEKK